MVRNKHNTPVIIKYPFWQMTAENPKATYACINYGEAYCPKEIEERAICIDGDIGDSFKKIIVVKDRIKLWRNEEGIVVMGIMDFLLNSNSLEL